MKTQDYLDVFARFKGKENVEAVERILVSHTEMEQFERSQLGIQHVCFSCTPYAQIDLSLGSLCCESAEEAKTLIPSLSNKISDVDLQEMLDEITKLRHFSE